MWLGQLVSFVQLFIAVIAFFSYTGLAFIQGVWFQVIQYPAVILEVAVQLNK